MNERNCFELTQHTPIYLYGAGMIGKNICRKLLDENYNLHGIIDKQGDDLQSTVSVYRLGEEPFVENACVIICLAIGVDHFSIARQIRLRGYEKILFLPVFLKSRAAKRMISIYNYIVAGDFSFLSDIPFYDELWKVYIKDYYLCDIGDFVTVIVHSDYIYTASLERDELHPFISYMPQTIANERAWFHDQPLSLDAIRNDMCEKLTERKNVYNLLQNALFDGLEYFVDAAAPAKLNPKGYFNLLDGHHRTSFLLIRGFAGIPLRVLKTEYDLFFREKAANNLMDYCKELGEIPFAVNHPAFVRLPVKEGKADKRFLRLISTLKKYESEN